MFKGWNDIAQHPLESAIKPNLLLLQHVLRENIRNKIKMLKIEIISNSTARIRECFSRKVSWFFVSGCSSTWCLLSMAHDFFIFVCKHAATTLQRGKIFLTTYAKKLWRRKVICDCHISIDNCDFWRSKSTEGWPVLIDCVWEKLRVLWEPSIWRMIRVHLKMFL